MKFIETIQNIFKIEELRTILSLMDEKCKMALDQLPKLAGAQVHSTVMLGEVDRKTFQKLGIGLTCDPVRKVKKQKAEEEN